jgi:hypothetical protein
MSALSKTRFSNPIPRWILSFTAKENKLSGNYAGPWNGGRICPGSMDWFTGIQMAGWK